MVTGRGSGTGGLAAPSQIRSRLPNTLVALFGAAALLRIGLIAYSDYQDRHAAVKYTDIDYVVFSDAAEHVAAGRSPYDRATYRYTPLLAWFLVPNLACPWFGKALFAACDLLIAAILYQLASAASDQTQSLNGGRFWLLVAWLFNPVVFVVSTRGSAESLIVLAVLAILLMASLRRAAWTGLALGLAIHLKLFPIIYSLPLFLYFGPRGRPRGVVATAARLWPSTSDQWWLISTTGVSLAGLTLVFWIGYGNEFLFEAYGYHFVRTDIKHNFSAYFYFNYLTALNPHESGIALLAGLIGFLPQAGVQLAAALALHRDLIACFFVQTLTFVALNKVYTSQYFLWYLPLGLLHFIRLSPWRWQWAMGLWLGAQAIWLGSAYLLEFQGLNVFSAVHLASLGMLVMHVSVMWLALALRS
ncbi:uncharacterized protein MONBRDRAFT_15575 [Monosiga brevicollis MX1]|uniref:GPI mannosyltransferase 1 n=1 Tax=Monosiga brevicollis TaxID=81824 RepID=A9UUY3_MONBE|nr:uncharacterized protein MONBRDRAFT_15575 [Monosiga brevicollis MX1]EDQ90989.1 predicted protein [Monosiga brevicollis MX1]|eukprot:XP_001744286.1 hypothetical protein [Monosiga brevicollis MX1]